MGQAIYKVLDGGAWESARQQGAYAGSADDMRDGFIHFSTAGQLAGTLARHFAGREGLLLVRFDADRLGPDLRWEAARNGQLFPHLYGALQTAQALATWPLPLRPDGSHALPEDLT